MQLGASALCARVCSRRLGVSGDHVRPCWSQAHQSPYSSSVVIGVVLDDVCTSTVCPCLYSLLLTCRIEAISVCLTGMSTKVVYSTCTHWPLAIPALHTSDSTTWCACCSGAPRDAQRPCELQWCGARGHTRNSRVRTRLDLRVPAACQSGWSRTGGRTASMCLHPLDSYRHMHADVPARCMYTQLGGRAGKQHSS